MSYRSLFPDMIRSYIRSFFEISKELPILDLERVEEVPPKSQQSQGGPWNDVDQSRTGGHPSGG